MKNSSAYIATIGIECHVQLNTKTKLFAGVDNDARDAEPNTLISPLCMGLPGALPVLNKVAIEYAIRAGIAMNCRIAHYSKFDRKNYFYPDLPLGYQITQYDEPIILGGELNVPLADGSNINVRIHQAHLEADAGKSTHPENAAYSLVDLNRAGTPLIEIVSEADMHTAEAAKAYARELYLRMKYAGVSDVNLFYGNMRFDVNVSVSKDGTLGTRTETKNLNSFRAVEKAVEYEIKRQIHELDAGRKIIQETRGWDDAKQKTFSQRSKEDAHDYRYFPDPDLPPVVLDDQTIQTIRDSMPVMPDTLRRLMTEVGIDRMSIEAILDYPVLAWRWFEIYQRETKAAYLKKIGDWFANDMLAIMAKEAVDDMSGLADTHATLNPSELVRLAAMVESGMINSTAASQILTKNWRSLDNVEEIASKMDLLQVSDESELEKIVEQTLQQHTQAVADIKNGEEKAIGFIVGQVMKATAGKANPMIVQNIVRKILQIN